MFHFFSFQRTQHKPSHQSQRLPSDPQKHGTGDLAPQRDLKRPMDGGGPGGKVPRMDRAYSTSNTHSGGRHSGSGDGYDPRRPSSFGHSERPGGSSKDRHDYGHRYHDTHRDRPSHHSSDYSRSHDRPSDHSRSHDQHSRSYERGADHHHSRSYDKRERRDDYHRSDTRDYSTESRHHSHRDRTSDLSSRHSVPSTSPKLGSTHDSKRYGEDKRTLDNDREKRWQRLVHSLSILPILQDHQLFLAQATFQFISDFISQPATLCLILILRSSVLPYNFFSPLAVTLNELFQSK